MSGPTWTEVRPGLVRIFGELAHRDEQSVQPGGWKPEWRDQSVKATANSGQLSSVKLYLKVTSCVRIGTDDVRYTQATPASDLQETIFGLRRVTLRLEVHASQVSDQQWSLSILERIGTRLARRRVIDALLALNVGIIDIGASTDISAKKDQHVQSRAIMDLKLTMVATDRDPIPTGWVQSVVITSELQDTDGTLLPTPPNYTDTITTP
jgi:hypothetical protein